MTRTRRRNIAARVREPEREPHQFAEAVGAKVRFGELTAGRRREPRCGPPPGGALVGDGAAEDAKRREREAVAVEMPAANLSVGERSAAGAWTQRAVRPAVALGPLRGGQDAGRDDRAPDEC